MDIVDPKVIYADILIALANADDSVSHTERKLLDGIFGKMGLSDDTVDKLWLTPRTVDVAEAQIRGIQDEQFRRCLLKDCFLLAYADQAVAAEESRFIKRLTQILHIDQDTVAAIREWVKTALEQKRVAEELFGSSD